MAADWTIAIDDVLTERLRRCTACGRTPAVHLGLHLLDGLAIATAVCARCHTQDRQQVALGTLLAIRYDKNRYTT